MIKQFTQSIGFFCPDCATATCNDINIFEISSRVEKGAFANRGNKAFACSKKGCTTSPIAISRKKDKYKIVVSCPFCDGIHEFYIKNASFWSKNLVLKCPLSDMNVFYIGDREKINGQINEQEEGFKEIFDEVRVDNKAIIYMDILTELHHMLHDGRIFCHCGSHDVNLELDEDFINVICNKCSSKRLITPTEEEYELLLDTEIFEI